MSEPTGGTPPPPQEPSNWQTPPPTAPAAPAILQGAAVEPGPAPGVAYADLGVRTIAFIIDWVLMGVISFVIILVVGAILVTALLTGGAILAIVGFLILAVLSLFASAVYFIYTWTTLRASPGQKLLNLETVSATDGATLTRDQAIRRWVYLFGPSTVGTVAQFALGATDIAFLGSLISLATFAYTIYLLYTANKSSKRQGYHDVQAGTVVVKRTQ